MKETFVKGDKVFVIGYFMSGEEYEEALKTGIKPKPTIFPGVFIGMNGGLCAVEIFDEYCNQHMEVIVTTDCIYTSEEQVKLLYDTHFKNQILN